MTDAPPPMGHNNPPDDNDIEKLLADEQRLIETANRWRAERPSIVDAEMAGAGQLLTDQLKALRDDIVLMVKRLRREHDEAIERIKQRFADPQARVAAALDGMQELNLDWLRRERERLAAEKTKREEEAREKARKARELEEIANKPGATVEQQVAADRASEEASNADDAAYTAGRATARTKGDYAAKAMSLRSNWKARVIDDRAALRHFRFDPDVERAALVEIVRVASKLAKLHKDPSKAPPGVAFYNDERAQ